MESIKYMIKLNMKDTGILSSGIRLKQGDHGMFLLFKIFYGNNEIYNADEIPNVVFKRPDGSSIVGTATANGQQYQYKFEGNELEIAGKITCDVKFETGTLRESTASFSLECVPDTVSNNSQGSDIYVNDLAALTKEVQKAADNVYEDSKISRQNAALAQSYAVGTDNEVRENDSTDNAMKYCELAQKAAEQAVASKKNTDAACESVLLTEKEISENIEKARINAQAAADSMNNAQTSAELTAQNLVEVQRLTQEAKESTANAENHAGLSKSYAVGTNGEIRENDTYDNAKSYCEQAKSISESLGSPITPQGTVAFEDLPPLSEVSLNWMYNISNEFITTDDFAEGAGNVMPAGTNVYKIASGKWDCFAGSPVTGIKGNKEKTYRKGNVNLTPENIGALAEDGDSGDNTVTFASADSASPAAWTDVPVLATGEKHSSLFGRISTMFKNVRYLYRLLGTTDISGIGDGTATGAIKAVNTDLANYVTSKMTVHEVKNINSNPYTFVLPTNKMTQYAPYSYIAFIYYKDIYSINGIGVYLIRNNTGSWIFYEITNQHGVYMNITETGTSDLYPYVKFSGSINLSRCKATLFRLD